MPRITKEWSAKDVQNAPSGVHFVGGVSGLTLQVGNPSTGTSKRPASWVLRVCVGSTRRNLGLGKYPEISLQQARKRALELKSLCVQGIDPLKERADRIQRAAESKRLTRSFRSVADDYLRIQSVSTQSQKHRHQWRSSLQTYVYPKIGDRPIAHITVDEVLGVLQPIWDIKTETASRVQKRMERVFDLAVTEGLRPTNPARWRNFLSLRLPAPGRIATVQHYPSVPYQGLPEFMQALSRRNGMAARALVFLILTAVRSGSVRQAKWSEIDFQAREWRIPSEHTKTRSGDHRVPLTDQMIRLLRSLPRTLDQPLIFPSPKGRMLSDMALNVLMRKMRTSGELPMDAVPHGFRSTFRVWAAEATDYPSELAELCLMHSVGSTVYRAYQRSDLFEKRRDIMRDWNEAVYQREAKVVAIG